ncbi:MAG: endonuclease domain-containing protein [Patescibacteria group bacterium]
MRKNPTFTEKIFWQQVRGKQISGYKIRRQHPIDKYVVDFYCARFHLIIEIDGDVHRIPECMAKDTIRTDYFFANGYQLIRFTNNQILNDLPKVLLALKQRLVQLTLAEASLPSHGEARRG